MVLSSGKRDSVIESIIFFGGIKKKCLRGCQSDGTVKLISECCRMLRALQCNATPTKP
jgi:hypothetical protein